MVAFVMWASGTSEGLNFQPEPEGFKIKPLTLRPYNPAALRQTGRLPQKPFLKVG